MNRFHSRAWGRLRALAEEEGPKAILASLLAACVASSCTQKTPPRLTPRVISSAGLLTKTRAGGLPRVGGVTEIVLRRPRTASPEALIVAGTEAVAILEPSSYRCLETVRLNDGRPPFARHHVIDPDGDGTVEFLRESLASDAVVLYDLAGRVLWTAAPPGGSFPHAAWGDLDGRGKLSFVLWRTLEDEVALHDASGRLVWTQRWEKGLSAMKILDLDGDNAGEIVCRDQEGISIRDAKGALLRRQPRTEASDLDAVLRETNLRALPVKFEPEKPPYATRIRELRQGAFPAG